MKRTFSSHIEQQILRRADAIFRMTIHKLTVCADNATFRGPTEPLPKLFFYAAAPRNFPSWLLTISINRSRDNTSQPGSFMKYIAGR